MNNERTDAVKAHQAKSRGEGLTAIHPRSAGQFPWTKEEDALLGRFTDEEVARKLGYPVASSQAKAARWSLESESQSPASDEGAGCSARH